MLPTLLLLGALSSTGLVLRRLPDPTRGLRLVLIALALLVSVLAAYFAGHYPLHSWGRGLRAEPSPSARRQNSRRVIAQLPPSPSLKPPGKQPGKAMPVAAARD